MDNSIRQPAVEEQQDDTGRYFADTMLSQSELLSCEEKTAIENENLTLLDNMSPEQREVILTLTTFKFARFRMGFTEPQALP